MNELSADIIKSGFAGNLVWVGLILAAATGFVATASAVGEETVKPASGTADFQLPEGKQTTLGLYVTAAEQIASCPWQAFVGRLLRVEPAPDSGGALPSADPRMVGALVHAVLQRLGLDALGQTGLTG